MHNNHQASGVALFYNHNLHQINNKFEYVFNIHSLHLFRLSDFDQRLNCRIASRIHVRQTTYDKRLATAD